MSVVLLSVVLLASQVGAGALFDSHDLNIDVDTKASANAGAMAIGTGGDVKNTFIPTNIGINEQSLNNKQVISPSQEITINAPSKLVVGSIPNVPDAGNLYFISPNERDVQTILPKFGTGVIEPLKSSDCIVDVLYIDSDIKFKGLYKAVLKGLRSDQVMKLNAKSVRYQIREVHSTKTWTTGGSLQGGLVGDIGTAIGGASGGIIPQVGRSKSSNLYTVIFVQVQVLKK